MAAAEKPDVVGAVETAEICGIEVERISRWRAGGKLPPPAADLRATPVWERSTVTAVAAGEANGRVKKLPLMGLHEAAAYLVGLTGLEQDKASKTKLDGSKRQISRWRAAGTFPEPCLDRFHEKDEPTGLHATPLWWKSQIVEFKRDLTARRREERKRAAAAARERKAASKRAAKRKQRTSAA